MRIKLKKPLSILLAFTLALSLFAAMPFTAMAFADLGITVVPTGGWPGYYQLIAPTNPDGAVDTYEYWLGYTADTTPAGGIPAIAGTTITFPFNSTAPGTIGVFINVNELDSGRNLLNRCSILITNDMLVPPTPDSTAIAGGENKVTVSSYAAVVSCTLYLVPASLYPTGDGAISIDNSAIKEITANGDITSLSAGKYKLYTVRTAGHTSPMHGAYIAGAEVTVTAPATPPSPKPSGKTKHHSTPTVVAKEEPKPQEPVTPAEPSKPEPMKPYKPVGATADAAKTSNPLIIDGDEADFPAVKIDGWNWLKLRDVAMLLSGTSKQFSIGYDEETNTIIITTGEEYEPLGGELEDMLPDDFTAVASGQKILFNGKLIEVAAYNIDGFNYFRLRDLMILLDIFVSYDEASGSITLDLGKPYSE